MTAISGTLTAQRNTIMRKKLLERCLSTFRTFRLARNEDPDCVYLTKEWPQDFDYENIIESVKLAQLREQP